MNLHSYKDYFDRLKVGDRVHYIAGRWHFSWVIKHRFPGGFLGWSLSGTQKFTPDSAFNDLQNNYIQPKEDRLIYRTETRLLAILICAAVFWVTLKVLHP